VPDTMGVSALVGEDVVAWLDTAGVADDIWRKGFINSLTKAGVQLEATARSSSNDPGIIAFESVSSELIRAVREWSRSTRLLAVVARPASLEGSATWQLLQSGAADVVVWDQSAASVQGIVDRLRRWRDIERLVSAPVIRDNLVGESVAWQEVLRDVVEVAAFTDLSVLITGESGTGKELVARLIHSLDRRRNKGQLVLVDCTTLVPSLAASELFGHEKGAFTGAASSREGACALADGGTLFLDEVGELPTDLQAELLRVVQEGAYKRVGGNTWHDSRFRLVCATNRDLQAEQAEGTFRKDFYHRIATWRCQLPSLRERRADVIPLATHFLREALQADEPLEFDPVVRQLLTARDYPGNVRELRQLVRQIARRHVGSGPITPGEVPPAERPALPLSSAWPDTEFEASIGRALATGIGLKDIGTIARETAVAMALREAGGNLQRAAKALGVTDRALQLRRAGAIDAAPDAVPG
jgi:transcriptional regulator with GAF, ATPase, and Fis domain